MIVVSRGEVRDGRRRVGEVWRQEVPARGSSIMVKEKEVEDRGIGIKQRTGHRGAEAWSAMETGRGSYIVWSTILSVLIFFPSGGAALRVWMEIRRGGRGVGFRGRGSDFDRDREQLKQREAGSGNGQAWEWEGDRAVGWKTEVWNMGYGNVGGKVGRIFGGGR